MMTALATVTGVNPLHPGYQLNLSCQQQTSCSHCASSKSCGTGLVSNALGNKVLHWQLTTSESVNTGQVVEIGFPEKSLLQSAALVYLFPLLMLFVGVIMGQYWLSPIFGGGELPIIVTALIGIVLGIGGAKKMARRLALRTQSEVVLIRVLGNPIAMSAV